MRHLLLTAVLAATPILASAAFAPMAFANDLADQVLAVHNAERAEVGVAPLTWSDSLAQDAQAWANHLADIDQLVHAGSDTNANEGENLAAGSAGGYTDGQLAQLWADEKSYFVQGTFPDVSSDGNWASVGHYTQMIWANTTQVGCGHASSSGNDYLVCRYSPAGNYLGEKVY